jgi:alpha-L-fucosidase
VRLLATGEALDHETSFEVHEQASRDAEPIGELVIAAPAPSGALVDVIAIDFA